MKYVLIATMLLLFSPIGKLSGQTTTDKQHNNYVVTTTKINQLTPILMAAQELKEEEGAACGEFKILICGKAVQDLANSQTVQPFLQTARQAGARIIACEYSMKQQNMKPQDLTPGVESVENAILENLQLQREGYISLGL